MKQSFTVRDLPIEERPRERLVEFGAQALSAQELLALILGRGVRGESVMMTAQKLLSKFGSLLLFGEKPAALPPPSFLPICELSLVVEGLIFAFHPVE